MAGTREDELKAQLNPFSDRAGLPGYGADGWKTPGLENQAMRDEGRRREQGQASVARQARTNAKKALRNGDYEGWTRWQAAAGGTTLGIQGAKQGDDISRATVDKQTQNAVGLNPSSQSSRDALVPPSKPMAASTPFSGGSGSSYGTGSSVAAPSAPVAPAPTTGTATTPTAPQAPASGIPARRDGESQFSYDERLAQARGKAQKVFGDAGNDLNRDAKDEFWADVGKSELIKNGDPKAYQKARERGLRLGIDGDQLPIAAASESAQDLTSSKSDSMKKPNTYIGRDGAFFDFDKIEEQARAISSAQSNGKQESLFSGEVQSPSQGKSQDQLSFESSMDFSRGNGKANQEADQKSQALKKEIDTDYSIAARLVDTAEPFIIKAQSPRIQRFAEDYKRRKEAMREMSENTQKYGNLSKPKAPSLI